jgi:hypothetical protein
MGEIEQMLYNKGDVAGFDGATALARKVLKHGTKLFRDCYRYEGQRYWVVNGRCLTREQGEALEAERVREGRAAHPSDQNGRA